MITRSPNPLNLIAPLALAAIFFAAVAPTITWNQFASGSENLNVATALEIRRHDRWLVPTLQGQPRVAKPPLTAWITASLLRRSTLDGISNPDPAIRHAAYQHLAWQVRWPALLTGALMLIAVYELARILGGRRLALASAVICATTYAFLRFTRMSTTDVPLAMWVVLANLFIARAIFEGKRWTGCIGAGIALGFAFMSKGPVALVQTLAPALIFAIWRAIEKLRSSSPPQPSQGHWLAPILVSAIVMLAIAVPWFAMVLVTWHPPASAQAPELPRVLAPLARLTGNPGLWDIWFRETTRQGAITLEPDAWYAHASLIPMMLPWILVFIGGFWASFRDIVHRKTEDPQSPGYHRILYALFLLLVPILIMSLSRDRKDRYLLPMIGPAAIVAAYGLLDHLRTCSKPSALDRSADLAHWGIVAAAAVAFPLLGATGWIKSMITLDGHPWFSPALAITAAAAGLLILLSGILLYRSWPGGMTLATALVMLIAQSLFALGYSRTEGRSDMQPLADRIWQYQPDARVYCLFKTHVPQDLSIYLNRETPLVTDPTSIPSDAQVLVTVQRQAEPSLPIPPGWTLFATQAKSKITWLAYRRQ